MPLFPSPANALRARPSMVTITNKYCEFDGDELEGRRKCLR